MIDFKLWTHQEDGVKRALEAGSFAFLWSPGVGKTLATIQILRHVYSRHGVILPTIIFAPLIVLRNWKDEFEKFSNIPPERVHALVGSSSKRIKLIDQAMSKYGQENIFILNYEAIVGTPHLFNALVDFGPDVLVLDESQRIKNIKSKRTKLIINLADLSAYRYLLTGTPILNSPLDLFAQWRALDGGRTFGKNFFTFRAAYFYDRNANMPSQKHFPDWTLRPEADGQLHMKIAELSTRAKKEECLDLPPLVKQKVYVELPTKVRRAYDQMKDSFLAEINGKMLSADLAITKSLRMLQLVNGFIKDVEDNESSVDCPKLEALSELLGDLSTDHKVLVWACFKYNYKDIQRVCEKLKIKYVMAHGSVSNTDKFDAVDKFNNDPSVRVFIGHPGSLGIGINLVPADYAIYFSRTWNLEHDIQSQARNYRGGSEIHKKITRIDLVASNTIDEAVMKALENKMSSAEKIINVMREELTK